MRYKKLEDIKRKDLKEVFDTKKISNWLKKYPTLDNSEVSKWINTKMNKYARSGKDHKDFNVVSYISAFQSYCDHYKVEDPEELLKEDLDTRNERIVNYLGHLISIGKNEASVRNAYQSRIRSFYSCRNAPVTDGLDTMDSGVNHEEIELNKERIKYIQKKLEKPEYGLILKLQTGLGLRIGDVLDELTFLKQIKNEDGEVIEEFPKYKIEKNEKEKHYFIRNFWTKKEKVIISNMFFPTELSDMFKIIYGKECENDLTKLDLTNILLTRGKALKDENGKIMKDEETKKTIIKEGSRKRISRIDYLARIKRITKELGILKNVKTHSFRKFFSGQISTVNLTKYDDQMGSELADKFKEHLMGHKGNKLADTYKQKLKNHNWMYKNWKHLENAISIDYEVFDATDEEIETLKQENKELKERMKSIEEMMKKYSELLEKSEKLNNF